MSTVWTAKCCPLSKVINSLWPYQQYPSYRTVHGIYQWLMISFDELWPPENEDREVMFRRCKMTRGIISMRERERERERESMFCIWSIFEARQVTYKYVVVAGVSTVAFESSISHFFSRYNDLVCPYTGQKGILTPPKHLIPPLVYTGSMFAMHSFF